jgi:hypothetical protein
LFSELPFCHAVRLLPVTCVVRFVSCSGLGHERCVPPGAVGVLFAGYRVPALPAACSHSFLLLVPAFCCSFLFCSRWGAASPPPAFLVAVLITVLPMVSTFSCVCCRVRSLPYVCRFAGAAPALHLPFAFATVISRLLRVDRLP